jgi:hypothetical protein
MQFPLREKADFRQERAPRVLERVREQEPEDETAGDRKGAHERKQPEPAGFATDASHVEDPVGEEFGRCLTGLVTEVEDLRIRAEGIRKGSIRRVADPTMKRLSYHSSLGRLVPGVPGRQSPQTTGDEACRAGQAAEFTLTLCRDL